MNKLIPPTIQRMTGAESRLTGSISPKTTTGDKNFSEVLENAITDVDMSNRVSDKKLEMLVSGEDVDIHGTMIALQEADISIRTMSAFRDKITDAYKNLINMAI
jgi:flagellar hook-basal body complex protein FliE